MLGTYNGVKLSGPQSTWLRIAHNAGRAGLIEIENHSSLRALQRRELVFWQPTRTSAGRRVAWFPTDAGREWLAAEDREWGR